mmetsp:Transcript_15364/g.50459  ORF Transcript_15364/g.50459 Transcript_15364/m.50459 type:complete len:346 (+) Transcript_15364:276-1313(+)
MLSLPAFASTMCGAATAGASPKIPRRLVALTRMASLGGVGALRVRTSRCSPPPPPEPASNANSGAAPERRGAAALAPSALGVDWSGVAAASAMAAEIGVCIAVAMGAETIAGSSSMLVAGPLKAVICVASFSAASALLSAASIDLASGDRMLVRACCSSLAFGEVAGVLAAEAATDAARAVAALAEVTGRLTRASAPSPLLPRSHIRADRELKVRWKKSSSRKLAANVGALPSPRVLTGGSSCDASKMIMSLRTKEVWNTHENTSGGSLSAAAASPAAGACRSSSTTSPHTMHRTSSLTLQISCGRYARRFDERAECEKSVVIAPAACSCCMSGAPTAPTAYSRP